MSQKNILCSLFIGLLLLVACQTKAPINYTILAGEIKNPISDTLKLLNHNRDTIHTIILDEKNKFQDTITISEGYFKLSNGKEITTLYLKPTFNVHLFLDNELFDESLKYEGQGAVANNYLAQKVLLEESFGELNFYGYYAKLEEKKFLQLADSLYQVRKDLLAKQNDIDPHFKFLETKYLHYQHLIRIADYEGMHGYLTDNRDFKVSANFPDAFADINLGNEKLLGLAAYVRFLESYLSQINQKKIKADKELDFVMTKLSSIEEEIQRPKVREVLAYDVGKYDLNETKQLDAAYKKLQSLIQNEAYLKVIKEKYTAMKKIAKGTISPNFELENEEGELINLANLKGNYVYIDIWATWCLSCRREIPDFKQLQQTFANKPIKFVSICQKDTEEKWRKMLKEKALTGIQLFAPDKNMPFFKDYAVNSIPRFILLDKEGKILDANALRPSDPSLETILINLVN